VRMFTPAKTRRFEDRVRAVAVRDWRDPPLARETPIVLVATFWLPVPRSWSRKRQSAAVEGLLLPTSKPDLDNLVKAISDGMNGVVYQDDSAIVETRNAKRYSADPRVEVELMWRALV